LVKQLQRKRAFVQERSVTLHLANQLQKTIPVTLTGGKRAVCGWSSLVQTTMMTTGNAVVKYVFAKALNLLFTCDE